MDYSNYLIKIRGTSENQTDYTVPMENILEKTYKGTYSTLDIDSARNGNGEMVRHVLPHKVPHCAVEMRSMSNLVVGAMMNAIQARYTIEAEKKVVASIWIAELNDYVEAEMYVPDIEFTIKKIENGTIFYEQFTLEFIGY